jgi:hypothetical protein
MMMISALAVACSDDGGNGGVTGPTIADLAGTWNASSVLLTWNANPAVQLDLVQTLGATVTLQVTNQNRYTFTVSVPGLPDQIIMGDFSFTATGANTGTFSLTDDTDPPGTDPTSGTFTLSGTNSITINIPDAELVDFDSDGTDDEALLVGQFTRQ